MKQCNLIPPSFLIDHTTMKAGLYLRENRRLNLFTKIKVWDLRFVAPSSKKFIHAGILHSIEHIMAVKLREVLGDKYIGFYVFGCKTGFSFLSKNSLTIEELRDALIQVIDNTIPIISKDEIPCLTEKECGNPNLYNMRGTTSALIEYRSVLEQL